MENLARKLNKEKKYSYADYLTWPDNERWEIINGIAYNMSPSPVPVHQETSGELFRQIANYLVGKPCKVYSAPLDVRFQEDKKQYDKELFDVVQPDLFVVCDKNKIDDKGCLGAPDIVIEILSPSTASKDIIKKRRLYEKNKVKQYWIVEPDLKEVYIYKQLENLRYGEPEEYIASDKIKVEGFEGLEIDLTMVFGSSTIREDPESNEKEI